MGLRQGPDIGFVEFMRQQDSPAQG